MIACATYVLASALTLAMLLLLKFSLVWDLCDEFNLMVELVSMAGPYFELVPIGGMAWIIGCVISDVALKRWTFGIVAVLCAVAIIFSAVLSIKKYRREGYKPNYAAFALVCVYSIVFTAVSFFLIF